MAIKASPLRLLPERNFQEDSCHSAGHHRKHSLWSLVSELSIWASQQLKITFWLMDRLIRLHPPWSTPILKVLEFFSYRVLIWGSMTQWARCTLLSHLAGPKLQFAFEQKSFGESFCESLRPSFAYLFCVDPMKCQKPESCLLHFQRKEAEVSMPKICLRVHPQFWVHDVINAWCKPTCCLVNFW